MKYQMVVARNNLNSQYLLIYLLLKTVCFPKPEREDSKSITKGLFLQCSTQLPSIDKSLNIPIWTWSLLPVNLQSPSSAPLSALNTSSCMIITYVQVLIIFPLLVYKLLVGRTWIWFHLWILTASSTQSDWLLLNEGARDLLGLGFLRKRGLLERLAQT